MHNLIIKQLKNNCKNRFFCYTAIAILIAVFLLPKIAFASPIASDILIKLTNEERTAAGLNQLSYNAKLENAALEKARSILASQKFEHNIDGIRFSSWIRNASYEYDFVGENLAIDFETNEGILNAWLESKTHRENIFNPRFKEIGIASATGIFHGEMTTVIAQIFGTPIADNPGSLVIASREPVFDLKKIITSDPAEGAYILSVKINGIYDVVSKQTSRMNTYLNNYNFKNKISNLFSAGRNNLFLNVLQIYIIYFLNISLLAFYSFAIPSALYRFYSSRFKYLRTV